MKKVEGKKGDYRGNSFFQVSCPYCGQGIFYWEKTKSITPECPHLQTFEDGVFIFSEDSQQSFSLAEIEIPEVQVQAVVVPIYFREEKEREFVDSKVPSQEVFVSEYSVWRQYISQEDEKLLNLPIFPLEERIKEGLLALGEEELIGEVEKWLNLAEEGNLSEKEYENLSKLAWLGIKEKGVVIEFQRKEIDDLPKNVISLPKKYYNSKKTIRRRKTW